MQMAVGHVFKFGFIFIFIILYFITDRQQSQHVVVFCNYIDVKTCIPTGTRTRVLGIPFQSSDQYIDTDYWFMAIYNVCLVVCLCLQVCY